MQSEWWAYSEQTMSARWIQLALINGERLAFAERKQSAKWTVYARRTISEHFVNARLTIYSKYLWSISLYCISSVNRKKKPKWLPYPASCSAKFFYHILFFTKHLYLHVGIRVQKRQKWRRWYFYKRVIE